MRRLALALVVAVLVPAATVAGSAARSSTTAAACSKAAASKAMTRYGIGVIKPYQPKAPVYQVLCGPFLGPGSQHKDGAFTSCDGSGCLQNWDDRARVVAWGEANEWNAFHCLVEQKGVTCTVIGGKAAGRGFLINASGVTPVSS
jgi:hypothetical protein